MDAWQRLLDGEAEEWRLLLREEFGDTEMNYEELFTKMYQADKAAIDAKQPNGEAICFECGATCPLDDVYSGYEQSATAPCGHSWQSYRHNGQYVLE